VRNINCGEDGLCGGYRAWVRFGWTEYGDGINSTEVMLSCISGSGYIDMSDQIRCTDPVATSSNHKRAIGPIVGGTVGGLTLIIAALMLWYFRKKRNGRSRSPDVPQQDTAVMAEPSWFVDNETPWRGIEVNRSSPAVRPSGSQDGHSATLSTGVSTAPQGHDSAVLMTPLSASSRRTATDQSENEFQRLIGQPSFGAIRDRQHTTVAGPLLSSHPLGASNSTPTHPAEADTQTEIELLKAQMARMQSRVLETLQHTSLPGPRASDTGGPPAYDDPRPLE